MNDSLPIIYLTDEEYKLISGSRTVNTVDNTVSIELLKKILKDENFFLKVDAFFQSNKDKFGFIYKDNVTKKIISLTKIDIVVALNNYISQYKDVTQEELLRYQKWESVVSLPGLKKDYENYIYHVSIDNIDYHQ